MSVGPARRNDATLGVQPDTQELEPPGVEGTAQLADQLGWGVSYCRAVDTDWPACQRHERWADLQAPSHTSGRHVVRRP
jgi:hypothetical protein